MNISAYLITCALGGILGVILFLAGFKIFDKLTPKWDFEEAFSGKTFSGGSIVVAAFLLGLALIISRVAS